MARRHAGSHQPVGCAPGLTWRRDTHLDISDHTRSKPLFQPAENVGHHPAHLGGPSGVINGNFQGCIAELNWMRMVRKLFTHHVRPVFKQRRESR